MKANLVKISDIDSSIIISLVFKTTNNPLKTKIYPDNADAYLDLNCVLQLKKIQQLIKEINPNWRLFIGDAYRPMKYQNMLYQLSNNSGTFVAKPDDNSFHTKGIAVDIGIFDIITNNLIPFPPIEHSEKAHSNFSNSNNELSSEQINNRELLKKLMTENGFECYKFEWWHFNFINHQQYTTLNIDFDKLY